MMDNNLNKLSDPIKKDVASLALFGLTSALLIPDGERVSMSRGKF